MKLTSGLLQGICFIYLILSITTSVFAQTVIKDDRGQIKIIWDNKERLTGGTGILQNHFDRIPVNSEIRNGVTIFSLATTKVSIANDEFAGLFFNTIPDLQKGIAFWRYKPWNSWTKPMLVTDTAKMEPWDVQFFYWQYKDSSYGAAVPLSAQGFRTTLGSENDKWGSKAVSYATNKSYHYIPAMAIAFGKDPYELFARIYKQSLVYMGKGENLKAKKIFPEPFNYIGWCTWNSSDMGKNLDEEHLIEGVKTFTDHHFRLGWVLVDDGWFQHKESRLQSIQPDPKKFPNGFRSMNERLKKQFGIRYTGIWHAFDGYWNGIDPNSALGKHYKNQLFSWTQKEKVDVASSVSKTYYFIKPTSDSLFSFYQRWHRYLKAQGFDFVKVDNQLVAERMAVNNYPLFDLSAAMHKALYKSIDQTFNGAVINCMDMTADAYLNFGSSAVARAEEDYFPYEKDETYNLQRGNAAAHVLQAVYNSLYFSQMVFPDFDMFESHNPNAVFHALTRTLNNGPIYITDKPGQQNFDILNRIVYKDGRSIRAQTPLLPTEDCLFQLQEPWLFKTYSYAGNTGLLGVFNMADAEEVGGDVRVGDVHGIKGERFAVYNYFTKSIIVMDRSEYINVRLPRLGRMLFYVVPLINDFAPFGLTEKYNAPATILNQKWEGKNITLKIYEGGLFKAYAAKKPASVLVNGKSVKFDYADKVIEIKINELLSKPLIKIAW
ncbi:MAG: Sip1-related alpha-galactosidase [Chitinophagaceae bacterium]